MAKTIAKYEPVFIIAYGEENAKTVLKEIGTDHKNKVTIIKTIPNDDIWIRDSGAIFRKGKNGGLDMIGLNFNGWGNKQKHKKDEKVAKEMANYLGYNFTLADIVGEGGGIE